VRIAFAEKGVEVELLEIDPRKRPARLRELNPTGRVPVLEVDGVAIRESSVICEWLEDVHPDLRLWPSDPAARAVAKGLMRWVDDELTATFFMSIRTEAFGIDDIDHPHIVSRLRERLVRRWPVAEDLLGRREGQRLTGMDGPTLADLAAIPLAVRLPRWKPELAPDPEHFPRTTAWLERLRERPSAVEVRRKGELVTDA
jgi:glutathione S-transferase